jgi:hypothetical protein
MRWHGGGRGASPPRSEAAMESSSFDTLARIAADRSRRDVLRSAFASALAGLGTASLGAKAASAKKRKKRRGCRQWLLSGAPEPSSPIPRIRVDDDLTVFLNGQILFQDDDAGSSSVGPFLFAAKRGDHLRFVAVDTDPDCHELSPLFLRCACGGPPRKLSDGVPETCPDVAVGEFFNETFTI